MRFWSTKCYEKLLEIGQRVAQMVIKNNLSICFNIVFCFNCGWTSGSGLRTSNRSPMPQFHIKVFKQKSIFYFSLICMVLYTRTQILKSCKMLQSLERPFIFQNIQHNTLTIIRDRFWTEPSLYSIQAEASSCQARSSNFEPYPA